MREKNMKSMFLEALQTGRVRTDAINRKISGILDVINEADSAINSIYPQARIKSRVQDDGALSTISVFASVGEDLITRRVMDIEVNKSDVDTFYVTWREGKNPISEVGDLAELLSHIFSSPSFLIGIEDMISSIK